MASSRYGFVYYLTLALWVATRRGCQSFSIPHSHLPGTRQSLLLGDDVSLLAGPRSFSRLHNTPSPSSSFPDHHDTHNYVDEETLLCIHFDIAPNVSTPDALECLQVFTRSFPFAAVLPVQPLMYIPTNDGVHLQFLRKKSEEKSGIDGGIRFFIQVEDDDDDVGDADEKSTLDDADPAITHGRRRGLQLTAKRNSTGQSIQKLFAEKLVVTKYVEGLTNYEQAMYKGRCNNVSINNNNNNNNNDDDAVTVSSPLDVMQVTSVYHKWMDLL